MNDPRLTPDPLQCKRRDPAQVGVPLTDLCRSPKGPRDRQLLLGEHVTVLAEDAGWSYVQAAKDFYCGHLNTSDLAPQIAATHRVTALGTQCYARADMKSPDLLALSHGSLIAVTDTKEKFARSTFGFVPLQHLSNVSAFDNDPAAVAALFLHTPYLWGGNSRAGIDCSGLVQAACLACNIACLGDSDLQENQLGTLLKPGTLYARNDLLFWKGHVALVWDKDTLLHANAHSMAVSFEPLKPTLDRIARLGGGTVTAHKRL